MKRKSLLFMLLFALLAPWAANAQTTLWSEDFEGGAMPSGWTTDGSGTWTVGTGDYSTSTGAGQGTYNALIKHGTSGSVTKLITPEIDLSSVTSAVLSFMHVQRSWTGDIDYLKVYYRTSSSGTWTQLVEYTGAVASWTTEEDIILPNTTATYQLAFEHTDNYGYGVGLDQVVITPPAACPKPTLGQAEYISEEGASFQWTENGSATQWQLQYSTSADFSNPTTIDRNGIPAYAITGLAASTAYYVHVRSYCGDGEWTDWSNTVVFRTLCGVYGLPYAYGFEDAGDMECWTVSGSTSTSTGIASASDAPEGSKVFRFHYSERNAYLISPVFDGTSAGLSVTFQYMNSSTTTGYTEQFQVGYTTSATETDPTAFTYGETIYGQNEWVMYENLFPANTKRIAIKYIYTNGMYLRLDDFNFEVPSDCTKPTGLALTASGNTFTATWNGTADTYNIDINGTVTNNVTSPYTFTGEYGTTYTVMVQANCGGETSAWTNPQSVTTDMCAPENMCAINITLTDAYGDGGGQIQVVDVLTNEVLGTFTNANGSSVSYTLNVCDGRAINFVFASTDSWSYENGWVITDINGDVISEHVGCIDGCDNPTNGVIASYTVNCTVSSCRKPTNLATTAVFGRSAVLNWTENGEATAWVVAYGVDGVEFRELNANAKPFTLENLEPETPYYVKVRPVCDVDDKWSDVITFTTEVACAAPANVTVSDITATSATVSWNGEASSYNLRYRPMTDEDYATITFAPDDVWQDGTGYQLLLDADATAYGTIIPESGGLTTSGNASAAVYAEFEYKIPANADGAMNTQNVMMGTSATIRVPAGTFDWCVTNPTPGDRIWIAGEGRADDYVLEGGKTYLFVVQSNGDGGDEVVVTVSDAKTGRDVVWTEINNVTSPYTITVDPEKDYIVEVQANCGADGTSAWASKNFSTPSNCQVPTPLDVTDITASTATLNWAGLQDSYEVQYRTKGSRELLFFESFDGQPSTWTLTNATYDRTSSQTTDYFVYLGYNSTETAYLITPDLTDIVSVGTVEFYHRCYNGDATFQVGFSSTTNDVDAFTWGEEVSAAGVFFTAYDVAMPAGTKYVAVKSTTSATDICVFINDFGIYGNEIPAGEWGTATADTTSCPITGLAANREYEWQVRGVCTEGYTDWSELVTFTTDVSCPVPTGLTVSDVTGVSAVATWTSDASLFDIDVNGVVTEGVTNPYTLEDLEPATIYTVKVRANCGEGDYSEWSESYAFVTDCGGAKDLPYTYGFEDLGDYYACWGTYAEDGNNNNLGISTYDDAYDGSKVFVFSSYTNYGTDFDQYLISPELNAEGEVTLEFYYRTPQGYGTETFEVGYSADGEEFTWGDEIATNTTEWTPYNDTLPAGTKYVVIHYYSDYQYYLLLDGFKFDEIVTSMTQTIALASGVNWLSFNVETDLDAVKDALVAAMPMNGVAIAAQNDGRTTYNGTRWRGALSTLEAFQMYKITVPQACEITLEGAPIDPTTLSVIIRPGLNWIAFPYMENWTVTNTFAGFAINGDQVKSMEGGLATYNGSRWRGALSNLVPGQGYIYNSADSGDRPFVFPPASKSFNHGSSFSSSKVSNIFANTKLQMKSMNTDRNAMNKKASTSKNFKSEKK